MAYVRKHGNQLAIVHGTRDPETGKVRQRVLFKICSKPEARAAIGESSGGGRLRRLLENRYRQIEFDWENICAGIEDRIDELPDVYPYRQAEMLDRFRDDLCAFTRQLGHADPQTMYSAADLIRAHQAELEYLRDLIDWRLRTCDQQENKWNGDNEFFWRHRTQPDDVPPAVIEQISNLYHDGELDRVESLARLFIDCYEDYTDGHNYLGLVARDRGHLEEAIGHFERAVVEGRKLFPKRLAKEHYWVDTDTRPYMRGLRNLAQALHLAGRSDEALEMCDQLERECDDDDSATRLRAAIHLTGGRFEEAREAARQLAGIWPEFAYVAAFASRALGDEQQAAGWFLHGLLTSPRTGSILLGLAGDDEPETFEAVRDHNTGVYLYRDLEQYIDAAWENLGMFERIHDAPQVQALLAERRDVDARGRDDDAADRRRELSSLEHAMGVAGDILEAVS